VRSQARQLSPPVSQVAELHQRQGTKAPEGLDREHYMYIHNTHVLLHHAAYGTNKICFHYVFDMPNTAVYGGQALQKTPF
jgi:hypothetical protein